MYLLLATLYFIILLSCFSKVFKFNFIHNFSLPFFNLTIASLIPKQFKKQISNFVYNIFFKILMFSKIKSLFKEQNNPESAPSDFKHPEINGEEIGQCPFMSKQKNGAAPAPQKTEKKTK